MKTLMNTNIRKPVAGLLVAFTGFLGVTCRADNPIVQTSFTADPAPMVHDGTVYLYTGHDEDDATGFKMFDWRCYSSTDMVNWTDHGAVISTETFSWAVKNSAWASQCIYRNGKFYFYSTSAQKRNGTMSIGVAVSDSPTGPFVDALGKPLIANSREDIDPTVFIDDDGQAYMYWGNPNLYYVKLNEDMISYSGEIVKCAVKPRNYQEGPWFYKRNGHYYMAYASTCCPEGIGYSMSDSPTGPWEFKGQIMDPHRLSDGNHPGIIDYKGKSYVFGFNYTLNWEISPVKRERRSVCVAELTYNEDGTIPKIPWWTIEGVPQVGPFNPFTQVEAATICYSKGIKTMPRSGGQPGVSVTAAENGAYIKIKGVDFGSRATNFLARVAAGTEDTTIALRLDSETGIPIGILKVKPTGALDQWETQSCTITGARGVHDLYLKFFGPGTPVLNLDWWRFE
jgi:arabinoxylan arabinofuranohydrolase